ncbi:BrnT family toxin [Azospirillum sp. A26]|uniref:BrnT family toxin n=1 Tax=Azospirillum sp. A26 TaxID=3160607 RepID=UPI00366C9A02
MDFEWDQRKYETNIAKHDIDFEDAIYIFEGVVLEKNDPREYNGETRIIAYGEVDGRLLVVVYTWRDSARRIISARKANGREQRAYHATLSSVAPQPDG